MRGGGLRGIIVEHSSCVYPSRTKEREKRGEPPHLPRVLRPAHSVWRTLKCQGRWSSSPTKSTVAKQTKRCCAPPKGCGIRQSSVLGRATCEGGAAASGEGTAWRGLRHRYQHPFSIDVAPGSTTGDTFFFSAKQHGFEC